MPLSCHSSCLYYEEETGNEDRAVMQVGTHNAQLKVPYLATVSPIDDHWRKFIKSTESLQMI